MSWSEHEITADKIREAEITAETLVEGEFSVVRLLTGKLVANLDIPRRAS